MIHQYGIPMVRLHGFLTLMSFCFVWSAVCCFAETDLDRFELIGPVKSVMTTHQQLRTTHYFDRNGRLTAMELQSGREGATARYAFSHDDAGRLIEERTTHSDGTPGYRKLYRYAYDDRGRQTAWVATTEAGEFAQAEFRVYDDRGAMTEELEVSGSGAGERSLYDSQGHVVYAARYYQNRLVLEATHRHNTRGRLEESRFYSPEGTLIRKDLYQYDPSGTRVKQHSEFFKQSYLKKSVVRFELDREGNWITETVRRWVNKNGSIDLSETVVSRERTIAYY
ncbi:hypothetical protein W02_15930 [Nitrospira sp. KM1]|uniref:hypothetical protein n=1 Tax=Nitrospira sp. KM1 TaxID=1936990 RepID=UPI0013A79B0E|nr:hypothetical protein [Nitrospira sp. KM1]BCA54453.1 hypothetical protein W02_15930 [Nitrospira sp. KM1]